MSFNLIEKLFKNLFGGEDIIEYDKIYEIKVR